MFQIPGQMTHASVTLLLCSRLLAIFISPLNYLRGKREVRLPIETLSKICKALLQGSGNHVFMHFIRAKWERENSERLRYFLKCFLESKSLSLSSALIIDISLQSYGNSSIAGVPEITKPKKEKQAALCEVDVLLVVESTPKATETACFYFS